MRIKFPNKTDTKKHMINRKGIPDTDVNSVDILGLVNVFGVDVANL